MSSNEATSPGKAANNIVLAFGSRPSTKPPPYSEIEHIDNQDIKFALYLANVDSEDTTVRRQRKTEDNDSTTSTKVEKQEEAEKKCARPGCLDVIRKINTAGKKNRDEREDIAFEQQVADDECGELEEHANSLDEECNKLDSDTNNFESTKTDMNNRLESAISRQVFLSKETIELNRKLMVAQTERSQLKSQIKSLVKTISNLMWKGKRLSTAEESSLRSYIPSIHIKHPDPIMKDRAEKISSTSYYGKSLKYKRV